MMENEKIIKAIIIKTVVSVYLHKRQFGSVEPRLITRKTALKQAVLHSRIRRRISVLDSSVIESDPFIFKYNVMFEKFMFWLEEQTKKRHRCYDLEQLVGPLFCHLYLDILDTGRQQDAGKLGSSFVTEHINKVDKSKCDDNVKCILKVMSNTKDNLLQNGSDQFNFDDFRSNKIVAHVKAESLILLKKFVASSSHVESHILLLQALQSWFEFRIISENDNCSGIKHSTEKNCKSLYINHNQTDEQMMSKDSDMMIKEPDHQWFDFNSSPLMNCQAEGDNGTKVSLDDIKLEEQDGKQVISKIKQVINKTRRLPESVYNIRIFNVSGLVTCGFANSQTGLTAFAEKNILRLMPLQTLQDSVCGFDELDHIRFSTHSRQIYCLALSPTNDIICTGSADRSICIYSLKKIKLLKRLWGHLGPVYCLAISENCKYIASGSQDSTARLWGLRSGKPLRVFAGHTGAVTSLHFHPNSIYLATGSADRNARLWCLNDASTVRLLHAAKREVFVVRFSPNGRLLACASDDERVRVWDLSTSSVAYEFVTKESTVIHLAWSKSGTHLCGGTIAGVIEIWELKEIVKNEENESEHSDNALQRNVNGRLLSIDYTFGTWMCLSVPNYSPFDSL